VIVYELPLLQNNTASETFLHNLGAVRSVDWIFIIGAPTFAVTGRISDIGQKFYKLLFKLEVVTPPATLTFSSLLFPRGSLH